jgi:hypothetical protein
MRTTAACPVALIAEANHLAMCLAESEHDGKTYSRPGWQDADGNLYAAASWDAPEGWPAIAQAPISRPAWDTGSIIDMDAAARAQAALVFWTPASETEPTLAAPDALTTIGGMDGLSALAAMGLTAVETEDA